MADYPELIHYHLPGLFEFNEFYKVFLPLFYQHREYFYDWCDIGSIYGAPTDCIWGGGRVSSQDCDIEEVLSLMKKYHISPRLTFSNSLLREEHLNDAYCNRICQQFANEKELNTGIIIYSDLLLDYLKGMYSSFYFVSSTTKVLTKFDDFIKELDREDFKYVVPDFRLNKAFSRLDELNQKQKDKVEFLCNECCDIGCVERKRCYENVSRMNLGLDPVEYHCPSKDSQKGYRFSLAMENPSFISIKDIKDKYLPRGFTNFKIEGRGLGSAVLFEFILYYMTKPECQLKVREEIYLDNSLDLF